MKSAKSLVWVAWFFLYSTQLFALNYTNQELGFSATLPDNLPDLSGGTKVKALVSRGNLDGSKGGTIEMIIIQDLGAPIGRDDFSKRSDKPQNVTLEKAPWKSFQIDVFRVVENLNSVSFVTLNAQVPLKPHAIQITVSGPAADEGKLRKDLQTILASIDGRTNWLTEGERAHFGTNWIAVAAGLIILIIGRLRLSRHYGLVGNGARIAGFFILLLGFALAPGVALAQTLLHSLGVNIGSINSPGGLVVWIALYIGLIWGTIALLVKEHGNAYKNEANEATPPPLPSAQPPKKLITECRMCAAPIPPELQETVRTCPNCGADLSRAR